MASTGFAADCDPHWKELRASMLAFKELHFVGTVPGLPPGAIQMNVVEKASDAGADAIDVATKTELVGIPMKIPGLGDHTSRFTRAKFCTELARKDGGLTVDGQSPGAVMAEVFRGKPSRTEKVKVPAGEYAAGFYDVAIQTKQGKNGRMKFWVASVNGHRIPIRTVAQIDEMPMTFDVQLTKVVKR